LRGRHYYLSHSAILVWDFFEQEKEHMKFITFLLRQRVLNSRTIDFEMPEASFMRSKIQILKLD
jgi:hypothetical protein